MEITRLLLKYVCDLERNQDFQNPILRINIELYVLQGEIKWNEILLITQGHNGRHRCGKPNGQNCEYISYVCSYAPLNPGRGLSHLKRTGTYQAPYYITVGDQSLKNIFMKIVS